MNTPVPEQIEQVVLGGERLTIEQVVAVARHRARVSLAPAARHRIACCRLMVEELLERGEKVYGLTTGFGKLRDVTIARKDVERLQVNLIRSHAVGVGPAFAEDVVRAAVLLRANTLCRGHSGVRVEVVEALAALLNDGIYPYVPQQGSVGASGDLAPLSHLALVLMGDPGGRVLPRAERWAPGVLGLGARADQFRGLTETTWAEAALVDAPTFRPVTLQAKEGLALNNGTQFMTALGCLIVHDAERGLAWSELAAAMSLEAARGVRQAFQPELHRARDLPHQGATAARILALCEGSEVLDLLLNTAWLRRARLFLVEAKEHLQGLGDEARQGPLPEVGKGIDGLLSELERMVPKDGRASAPAEVLQHRRDGPRQQIETFTGWLTPLRRRATALVHALDDPAAPTAVMLREALVRALGAISSAVPAAPPVQDDYSLRCTPQVVSCAHRALAHAREVLEIEVDSATDNPLLFPPEPPGGLAATSLADYQRWLREPAQAESLAERVLGGGNFHGEPVGMVLDYLAIALAEVASIAERRIALLVDEGHSGGLPPFLVESSGLNSGFMLAQYTAAALVSENKVLCHPATVDSIPTCAGSEDHVSMGTIAARKGAAVLENALQVIAIELLAGLQGLGFRAPLRPGRRVAAAVAWLRAQGLEPVIDDRLLQPDMLAARALLRGVLPV